MDASATMGRNPTQHWRSMLRACVEMHSHSGASYGRADARRRDTGNVIVTIIEESYRNRCPRQTGTVGRMGLALQSRRCSSTMHPHRLFFAPCACRAIPMRAASALSPRTVRISFYSLARIFFASCVSGRLGSRLTDLAKAALAFSFSPALSKLTPK
jgi:hypothetical protein